MYILKRYCVQTFLFFVYVFTDQTQTNKKLGNRKERRRHKNVSLVKNTLWILKSFNYSFVIKRFLENARHFEKNNFEK